jgi:hypothetical protein
MLDNVQKHNICINVPSLELISYGYQAVMFHLLLESVLLEFDHYLVIYTFSSLQYQFQPQKDYD